LRQPLLADQGDDLARRVSIAVLMLAGIGLLVWAGIYNMRSRRAAMQQAQARHMMLIPDGSAAAGTSPDASSDADASALGTDLRGKPAPGFAIKTVDGKSLNSSSFAGHPMIVNFWATYCGPCKLEMPWFEEFSHKYAGTGLQVVGIDDEDGVSATDVKTAAKRIGVTYPILLADSKTESAWGLGDYLPVTFYVDAKGIVRGQTAGAPSKDQMEAQIKKIVGGA
jgi:thiol-disulfide isomerase/thioredoxin